MTITAQRDAKIQADGNVTLPDEEREAIGAGPSGDVLLVTTERGVLITTRAKLFLGALAGIGAYLREDGVTLDELMESGAEIRQELVDEFYPRRPVE